MKYNCEICGQEKVIPGNKLRRFCSKNCESMHKRKDRQSDEWLYQKYVVEKMTCPQIAKIVNKDPKTVYTWMKDANIPTRGRGKDQEGKPKNYDNYWKGKKLPRETREKIRQASLRDGRVPYLKNGKHWLRGKRGDASPNYKGGITPERQRVHTSEKWKKVANKVWKRDKGNCQRCRINKYDTKEQTLHIHHIVSFANEELRYELDNLILLCKKCHSWVHSKKNNKKEFIREL